jgi:cytochrome P450
MISTQQPGEDSDPARDGLDGHDVPDFDDPAFLANPFPALARLRAAGPVHAMTLSEGRRAWLVTRFEDATRLFKDPRVSTMAPPGLAPVLQSSISMRLVRPSMLEMDPPDHARLRGLVSRAFTPRFIEGLRPRIQQIADSLIDAVLPRGEMEFISEFAFPLPITVICEMLGIPPGDRDRLRDWSAMIFDALSPREDARTQARADEFADYLSELIETKRREPREDLVSRLVHAEDAGGALGLQELRAMIVLLIFAGHETTVNLLGNGLAALFAHPDELDKLEQDASLVPAAIEELLRFCSPALAPIMRYTREDVEIGDMTIPRGEVIVISLSSANRDQAQFHDAEVLHIARTNGKHLAFGHGVHFCLGAPLARLEGQVALATLLRRLPGLRLNTSLDALRWRGNILLRGLQALPVAF